jgi:glycosyltransferase involved in cell wall biosynthesis
VPSGRIRVIYNGIEPRFFADESATGLRLRRELGIPADALVIGIIARLSPEKGHDRFLRIAGDIARQRPQARFLIVGGGPLEAELRATAAALGLDHRVVFTGARRDVIALNHVLDIFALPSREEALPLAVLEAMAARRPIVASAVGGVPEVVRDGQTGFLFPPDEHDRFVKALLRLADHPELREELGRRGQQRVRSQFGVARMVHATLGYYDALLATSRAAGRS